MGDETQVQEIENAMNGAEGEAILPLKLQFPDANSRGFVKRQMAANKLQLRQMRVARDLKRAQTRVSDFQADKRPEAEKEADVTALMEQMYAVMEETDATLEEMVAFALTFVVEPKDRAEARKALEDLTQGEWNAIFTQARGGNAVPKENSAN